MPETVSAPEPEVVASGQLVTEKSLADSWRVSVKQLAAMRRLKLRKKFHWEIVDYTVRYTKDGVERLKELMSDGFLQQVPINLDREDLSDDVAQKQRWKVLRVAPNPRMVLIENQWSAEARWLFVIRNKNFKRGMIVQDGDISTPDVLGRYHLTRRLPRTHGRW